MITDPQRYAIAIRYLHWLMALLIIALLGIGWQMGQLPQGEEKFQLIRLHKSLGVLAMALICLRIPIRLLTAAPPHGVTLQDLAARVVHWLLYIMMVLIPLTGIVMSWAGSWTTSFFSLFTIPGSPEKYPALASFAHSIHVTALYGFGLLIALHVAGFCYHQFIKKDNLLTRMRLKR